MLLFLFKVYFEAKPHSSHYYADEFLGEENEEEGFDGVVGKEEEEVCTKG